MLFDRLVRRMGRAVLPSTVQPGQVLLLAVLSIVSHPILDTLNTYGVRWLMPFQGDWYYGDTLFIVDPWLWLMLAVGVVASAARADAAGDDRAQRERLLCRGNGARRAWPRAGSRGASSTARRRSRWIG